MKAFLKWPKAHPWKATGFFVSMLAIVAYLISILISINSGTKTVSACCTEAKWASICYLALLVAWSLVIWLDCRKVLSVLLALSLLALPARAQEQPKPAVYAGCAVVVIVVGVVVTVKLKKFCDKYYKRQTNSPPEELYLSATGSSDTSAAVDNWFCGYCTSAPDLSLVPSLPGQSETIIEGTISGGNISLTVVTNIGTYTDFVAEMSALGLSMQPGKHYARNGQRANQWDTPILFPQDRGEVPHVIVNGDNPKTTVVFRSFDLSTWTPILTNTIPSGMTPRFEDNTTASAAFYRVTNL